MPTLRIVDLLNARRRNEVCLSVGFEELLEQLFEVLPVPGIGLFEGFDPGCHHV